MSPRVPAALFSLLSAASLFAQTADLTLSLQAAPTFNAGEVATVTAMVKNLGPDAATAAGVRLTKLSTRTVFAEQFGCIELPDSILCNVPALESGQSHEFHVPFVPPDGGGAITLSARSESFTLDPNHDNDAATASATVVQRPDLVTTINTYPGLQPGKTSQISVVVTNVAAQTATGVRAAVTIPAPLQVVQSSRGCSRVGGDPTSYTCALADLSRGQLGGAQFTVLTSDGSPDSISITASTASAAEDWNPADNRVASNEPVVALPDLTFSLAVPEQLDGSNRGTLKLTIANPTDVPAVSVTADIRQLGTSVIRAFDATGWSCHATEPFSMLCTTPALDAHSTTTIAFDVQYPAHEMRGPLAVTTTQTPVPGFKSVAQTFNTDAVYYRTFEVTSVADSGAGSLRQAIVDANAQCSADQNPVPCRIAFKIAAPVPSSGWFTIEPLSPLPAITVSDLALDGEAQTQLTGDTNPLGPEVYLVGDSAGDGDALYLTGAIAVIHGLTIGGFAQNAIQSVPRPGISIFSASAHSVIEHNYLGLDPTGRNASPNGLRGIMAYRFHGEIAQNVLSGNRRSGIFLIGADDTSVTGNRIGVAAATDDPLPNEASGAFFLDTTPFHDVKLQRNVIAFNGEYGVATSLHSRITLLDNVIARNRTQIDMGLDGPTRGYVNGFVAPQPFIASARYDAATGDSIVEGIVTLQGPSFGYQQNATVFLYANMTDAEGGEQFIGSALVDQSGHYSLRVHRDLRGQYIDATTYMTVDFGDLFVRMSSEFGRPVLVTN